MVKFLFTIYTIAVCIACLQPNEDNVRKQIKANENARTSDASACHTFDFKYLIVKNVKASPEVRTITVFLNVQDFSEENLKELFSFLSKEYPKENILTVRVLTDWAQVNFPSDCPGSGVSGSKSTPPENYDYHEAFFRRMGEYKSFRYNPELKSRTMKRIPI